MAPPECRFVVVGFITFGVTSKGCDWRIRLLLIVSGLYLEVAPSNDQMVVRHLLLQTFNVLRSATLAAVLLLVALGCFIPAFFFLISDVCKAIFARCLLFFMQGC